MNKKVEWYGEIPANIKWLTFADQRDKGYEYNKYFTEITASTDDNGGSITDEIEFNVAKNNTLQKRYAIVNFRQRGGKPATYKVSQKAGSKHNRLPVIDYDTLKLSVTPDGENIGWNSTSYTFSALANYDNVVYWYVDENDPKDKEHEFSRTPTSYTVTNDSTWTSNTIGVNVGSSKGNFTFESNTSASYKIITVSATYTIDGHSISDDGSVIQGLSEEPQYQGDAYISDKSYLEVTPDGGNIGYDVKEYQFSAVLHAKYARKYIIPLQGTEVKVDEDYGKNHGLNTDDDVTTVCNWEVVSSKSTDPTNISVEKGLAKFNKNLDDSSSRDIYVKATYSKDGLTKSDEGNITQKAGSKHNRPSVIDYDTLKLSVTPDGENIGWNSTSYTFTAVANYEKVVYWYIDENDPKDKEHEFSRTPTSYTVTNESTWASNTIGVNVGSNGNFTFESNTSASYKTITVSATYTKDGHSISDDGSVIQGLTEEPQYQGDAYISDKSYLEVTPDGGNIGYDAKEYQFNAVLHVKYARKYIIPSQGTDVKVDEDYGKNNNLNTDDDVTDNSYCKWEVVSSKSTDPTNISVEKGLAKFNENLDDSSSRDIYVKATYNKDGLTKSDEGNITQGTGVRTYQLEVNPVTLTWKADELNKQEFTVKSTYNDNYRFDYTISALTNFNYKKLKSEGLIDTYEIWPINNNPSKNLVSEDLHVIQNENKNEKSLALNQLGVDMTPPFDYMVLKYNWTDADGRDFDTATHVEGTEIDDLDNKYVGYGFVGYIPYIAGKTSYYLQHGGDNRQSGAECAMINMKEIMDKCGDIESFDVYVAGNWYSRRDDGNVTCEMTLYSGGTMEGPTNFVFTNSGGNVVDNRSLTKNVFSKGYYIGYSYLGSDLEPKIEYAKAFYTTVAKITYYVKSKTAKIEEDKTNNGVLINNFGAYSLDTQWNAKNIDAGEYKSRDSLQFKIEGEFTKGKEEERTFPITGTNVEADIKQYSGSTLISDTSWGCKINNVTVIDNMISYDITIPENTEKFAKTFEISFTVKTKLYEGGTEFDKTLMRRYKQEANPNT